MTADIEAAAAVLGERARRDVPLGPFTTYRVGGPAALLLRAEDEDDLERARQAVALSGVDVLVVGRGSNLLVADSGFPGLVLTLGDFFATIEVDGTSVRAGGALSLPVLARRTAAAGLTGLEWAVGVPGSVGGGVRMNAGGHGSEIRETLVAARLFDLTGAESAAADVPAGALALGYRRSAVRPAQVVVAAEFGLAEGDRAGAEAELAAIVRWRRENQPGGANAGSVFTNPPGDSAGRLIEAAGCKGRRRGSAFVSPKHANFFQVDDHGRAADVLDLMDEVRAAVHQAFGVLLETEVRMIGFPQPSISPGG
ncbi:MAG: UDP-N-acetylmuramate dehydrogenase [Actinomycetota bacterium]|jgi:UDP-N-acetylmuramate dehydrogenase|nr:UDP-N-acetylmuramate dehydrogenase [Actinomycetota bacterium]